MEHPVEHDAMPALGYGLRAEAPALLARASPSHEVAHVFRSKHNHMLLLLGLRLFHPLIEEARKDLEQILS